MAVRKKEPEKKIDNLYEVKKRQMFSGVHSGYYEGINRIFNNQSLYSKYRLMLASNRADHLSILSDWNNVGADLNKAIKDYEYSYLGEHSD